MEGTTWERAAPVYDWASAYEFRANGRLIRNDSDGDTFTYTWKREGDIVTFISSNGYTLYEGKYYPQTQRIMITYTESSGRTGDTTLVPFQGSLSSTAPSPQTNIYVQPSAPAQAAPAPQARRSLYAITVYYREQSGTQKSEVFYTMATSAREAESLARGEWERSAVGLRAGNTFVVATAPVGSQ